MHDRVEDQFQVIPIEILGLLDVLRAKNKALSY